MTTILTSAATGAYRAGEKVITYVRRPAGYTSSTKGCFFVHGGGVDATSMVNPLYSDRPKYIAGHDFPMFGCDFGDPAVATGTTSGPHSWGNDNAIAAFADAKAWLAAEGANKTFGLGNGACTGTFVVYAGSMGALTILNYLISLATPASVCAGVALTIPTLDLDGIYQGDKGGFRSEIGDAYGVTHPTAIPNLATHSPFAYSAPNLAKLTMPIRIWASSNDTIGSNTAACQSWAATIGSNVTVVNGGALGHSSTASSFAAVDLLAFLQGV